MSEQQAAKIPRVGFLAPGAPAGAPTEAFRQGLAKLGYVDGQNIVIEGRFAEGQFERFPQIAADLAGLKVDVIAMVGAVTARAAQKVVTDIPWSSPSSSIRWPTMSLQTRSCPAETSPA